MLASAQLLGASPQTVEQQVDDVVGLETALAEIMASGEERRNISDVYLKTDLASMSLYFPQYDWKTYFDLVLGLLDALICMIPLNAFWASAGPGVSLRTPVAVYCVRYLLELVHVLSNSEYRTIQNYLIWRFVRHRLNNLGSSKLSSDCPEETSSKLNSRLAFSGGETALQLCAVWKRKTAPALAVLRVAG